MKIQAKMKSNGSESEMGLEITLFTRVLYIIYISTVASLSLEFYYEIYQDKLLIIIYSNIIWFEKKNRIRGISN